MEGDAGAVLMKPLSQVLSNLIVLAEDIVTRPQMVDRADVGDRLHGIAAEVRHADARPAENIRTTRVALVMVIAIEEQRSAALDGKGSPCWEMIVAAMLPMLRQDSYIAFRNERAQGGERG